MRSLLYIFLSAALAACGTPVHESKPVEGGHLTIPESIIHRYPLPHMSTAASPLGENWAMPSLQFDQGFNAESPSEVTVAPDGTVHAVFGTNRANAVTLVPPPDYLKYILLGVSILAIGAGIYLVSIGWVSIGWRTVAAGAAGVVFSFFSLLCTLAALGIGLVLGLEKWHAYQKGLTHGSTSTP